MGGVCLARALVAVGTALTLVACTSVDGSRRSSGSATVRCVSEPGRGESVESTRPLFFLFCAQSP